ncbi:MAG: carboxylesterase family protein [Gammaproteobacteria bacterium]|nr:carboxylesterase family protein [Gammaproteobacteria bacterium]
MGISWASYLIIYIFVASTTVKADSSENLLTPVILANNEQLIGQYTDKSKRIAVFKGIPFAAPPVGNLRWQAPHPNQPRTSIQKTTEFAAACYQDSYNTDWYRDVGAAFGASADQFNEPQFSEDCLYLNLWTSSLDQKAKLPVMIWIHGGSNKAGWSFETNYLGANLAEKGNVVVVSIAYRLGIFGFFNHPELQKQQTNFGLLDQIAAIRWVKQNIKKFAGDPENITLFGESAGAENIGYLMTSPLAEGLFQRAISQSGAFQLRSKLKLKDVTNLGIELDKATLTAGGGLKKLRKLSAPKLFQTAKKIFPEHYYTAVPDGYSLKQSAADFFRNKKPKVDLLIGTNNNEWYMYIDNDAKKLQQTIQSLPVSLQPLFTQRAAQEKDNKSAHDKISAISDMICSGYYMANKVSEAGHNSWVYTFNRIRPGPGGEKLRAYHGAEIPYVFNTHDSWFSSDKIDVELTNKMMEYWINFARTGNPNGKGLDYWAMYTSNNQTVMELGNKPRSISAPEKYLCEKSTELLLNPQLTGSKL